MTNESNDHRARSAPGTDGVDAERLLSRIVDGEATDAERAEFERLASESPELSEELAAAERAHGFLAGAVAAELDALASIGPAGGVAGGGIGTGVGSGGRFAEADEEARSGLRRRIGLVGAWGGWAVAAALLLGMFLPFGEGAVGGGEEAAAVQSAGFGFGSIDDAMRVYMQRGVESGRVVEPEPRLVLIEARPEADGMVEVRYMRQIIERALVDDVYELAPDDGGVLVPVRLDVRPRRSVAM
ncbi:MAG: hypothetical protein JJU33_00870 [Phycisphaerales bacterium]|nr:hypothetical protein [Phycisphaerales bacterium]